MTRSISVGRPDGAGDGQVTDRAVAHPFHRGGLAIGRPGVLGHREQDAVTLEHLARGRSRSTAAQGFPARCSARRPARSSCSAGRPDLFALLDPAVVQRPRFGALRAGSHWPNSSRKLRMRSLARAVPRRGGRRRTPRRTAGLQRIQQGAGLLPVARGPGPGSGTRPLSMDSCTDATISLWPTPDPAVAELDDLIEVVPGVDVHHRERQRLGRKAFSANRKARWSPCPRRTAAPGAAVRRPPRG